MSFMTETVHTFAGDNGLKMPGNTSTGSHKGPMIMITQWVPIMRHHQVSHTLEIHVNFSCKF